MWWRVWWWRGFSWFVLVGCGGVAVFSPVFLGGDDVGALVLDAMRSPLDAPLPLVFWAVCVAWGLFLFWAEVEDAGWPAAEFDRVEILRALGLLFLSMYAVRHQWFLPCEWGAGFGCRASVVFYSALAAGALGNLWCQVFARLSLWSRERHYRRNEIRGGGGNAER